MGDHVAIIGGGVSGIVTARVLIDEGVNCTVFECTEKLGGVWAENYVGFGIQVPSALYEFPDEPLPEGWDFCSGPNICGYIQQYALKYGVYAHTKFKCRVLEINPNEKGGVLVYEDDSGQHRAEFDAIVIATGVYGKQDKFIPDWKGANNFAGEIIHASDFLDLSKAEGKHVVSVGYGKSAFDCAQISTGKALSSRLLFREAHWCVPRKILGLVPFEWATFSRFGAAVLLPIWLESGLFENMLHAIPLFLTFFWKLVAFIFRTQLRLPSECVPDLGFIADFWGGHGIIPHPDFFPLVNQGKIKVTKDEIESIEGRTLRLRSGTQVPCDLLIAGTGYKAIRSFVPSELTSGFKEKDGFWLYRNMIHPNFPKIVFLNSETSTFTNITTASIQARWLVEMLAGNFKLPSKMAMVDHIKEMQAYKRKNMPNARAATAYMVQTHQLHYYDMLLKDMGASIRRKTGWGPMAALKEVFEPYRPHDYNTIVTGEFKFRSGDFVKPRSSQSNFLKEGIILYVTFFVVCVCLYLMFSGLKAEFGGFF